MKGVSEKQKKEAYRRANSNYFEGILQLRENNEQQFNEIVDYLEGNDCWIAKHIVQKNGIDLYVSSQKLLQKAVRWMKSKYNCSIKMTRTLHTRDTKKNKDLYRVTAYALFLKHKAGDIVEINGEEVKITSLGDKPSGKIVKTGKRVFIDPKSL